MRCTSGEIHAHEISAYEAHANEVHLYETYAYEMYVRGYQESIQLSGAYATRQTSSRRGRKRGRQAGLNKPERGAASGLGSCSVASGVA
jgi:hypothetical protein